MIRTMGIDGLIANGRDDYVGKAVALLRAADERNELRHRIERNRPMLFENDLVGAAFAEFLGTVGA
jgi:predicted O-linked N-acetylglucosamine transferase (SPINDLY family)